MPLDSTSTLQQVQAAYDDNASYAARNSLTAAQDFCTAARILLRLIPQESSSREGSVRFQLELIGKEIDRAEAWIAAGNGQSTANAGQPGPPPFTRISTEYFRR